MSLVSYQLGNGRTVYRFPPKPRSQARSGLALPQIMRPFREPVQSMADGRFYDDAHSLRQSYKAENNPQGVDYLEVGDDTSRAGPERQSVTKQECADLLDQYEAAASRGELPELRSIHD